MQPNPIIKLTMREGPHPDHTFELQKEVHTVGREAGNDIVINDPQVSRHHARLTLKGGAYVLEDLGSTNGSYVNGRRVTEPATVAPGDMIGFGDTIVLEVSGMIDPDATQVARAPIAMAQTQVAQYEAQVPQSAAAAQPQELVATGAGLTANRQRMFVIGCAAFALVAVICVLGLGVWSFLDCPSFRDLWQALPIVGGISIGCG